MITYGFEFIEERNNLPKKEKPFFAVFGDINLLRYIYTFLPGKKIDDFTNLILASKLGYLEVILYHKYQTNIFESFILEDLIKEAIKARRFNIIDHFFPSISFTHAIITLFIKYIPEYMNVMRKKIERIPDNLWRYVIKYQRHELLDMASYDMIDSIIQLGLIGYNDYDLSLYNTPTTYPLHYFVKKGITTYKSWLKTILNSQVTKSYTIIDEFFYMGYVSLEDFTQITVRSTDVYAFRLIKKHHLEYLINYCINCNFCFYRYFLQEFSKDELSQIIMGLIEKDKYTTLKTIFNRQKEARYKDWLKYSVEKGHQKLFFFLMKTQHYSNPLPYCRKLKCNNFKIREYLDGRL